MKRAWALGFCLFGASAMLFGACGEPSTKRVFGDTEGGTTSSSSSGSSSSSSSSGGGAGGNAGTGGAGGNTGTGGGGTGDPCLDTLPLSGACAPQDAVCTKVLSRCIALEDTCNATQPLFRMAQLSIGKPSVFSMGVVANLIANSTQMDLPQCNLSGSGTFSWLLQMNLATNTFMSGGAEPVADPLGGYCFTKQKSFQGAVNPVVVDPQGGMATIDANGKATFSEMAELNLPIYLDGTGTQVIVLPLSQLRLNSVTFSKDQRCIGEYNAGSLKPALNCLPDSGQTAFSNGGSIDGYIGLEEADNIIVEPLLQSLCVLLSANAAMYGDGGSPARCKRDANSKIIFQGDWCAATNQPAAAGCADAMRFVANFAASAVTLGSSCP